jgi:hypothetical protein
MISMSIETPRCLSRRLGYKNHDVCDCIKKPEYIQNSILTCCIVWVWNMVAHTDGVMLAGDYVIDHGAKEDIWL